MMTFFLIVIALIGGIWLMSVILDFALSAGIWLMIVISDFFTAQTRANSPTSTHRDTGRNWRPYTRRQRKLRQKKEWDSMGLSVRQGRNFYRELGYS